MEQGLQVFLLQQQARCFEAHDIGVWDDANAGNWAAFDHFELVKK